MNTKIKVGAFLQATESMPKFDFHTCIFATDLPPAAYRLPLAASARDLVHVQTGPNTAALYGLGEVNNEQSDEEG